jgi:hypothetical protein
VRRTLYLLQKRQKAPAVQGLFDGPGASTESCPKRNSSTVPLQALYLLNNDFTLKRAEALAERVLAQAGTDRGRQVETAFRHALGRPPDAVERETAETFFAASSSAMPEESKASLPLVHFCQALLNLNEFVYLP